MRVGEGSGLRRHWSINGRFLTQPATGVQRYAAEIVRALDALLMQGHPRASNLSIDLVVPSGPRRALPLCAIRTVEYGAMRGHLWEQLVLPARISGGLLSLGNAGPLAVRHQIVCVHDVNSRAFPRSYSRAFRVLQRIMLPLLGRTTAQVATVSHYSAGEIVRYGIGAAGRIAVMPNGHEHALQWVARHSERTREAASPGTIVMIGTPAPHKNMDLILGLAGRLEALGLRIAVIGAADPKVYQARGVGAHDGVAWLGAVSDAELAALLQSSLCLAFPSFVEGFGLPPLEAMAVGCPVVASDRASMPEICGDAALYASPTNAEAWLDCFSRLRSQPGLRARMIAAGLTRARLFSWTASAECYLEAMWALDTGRTPRGAPSFGGMPARPTASDPRTIAGRQHEPMRDA